MPLEISSIPLSRTLELKAHLTNIGKQLLWAEPWVVPYLDTTVLNGITLTKKLIGELSDQQLANLSSEVNVIQRLSRSQIDKIGDEALQNLTSVQVCIASDNAFRRLKNPTLLVGVPMSKIHLLPIDWTFDKILPFLTRGS